MRLDVLIATMVIIYPLVCKQTDAVPWVAGIHHGHISSFQVHWEVLNIFQLTHIVYHWLLSTNYILPHKVQNNSLTTYKISHILFHIDDINILKYFLR